jgi:hypothetical protein
LNNAKLLCAANLSLQSTLQSKFLLFKGIVDKIWLETSVFCKFNTVSLLYNTTFSY